MVFLGDRVTDERGNFAVFEELSSSPAALEASKFCDMYGLLEGNDVQTADGVQAYCQAKLQGVTTCIRVPRHRWPAEWHGLGYEDPVCPSVLALYGHPDSGGRWEAHCNDMVKTKGWTPYRRVW